MERFRILPAVLVLALAAQFCASARAQASQDQPLSGKAVKAAPRPMPFPPGEVRPRPAATVEFRSSDRMSRQDRDLEADAESAIGERAGVDGMEFNQGKWSYQQVVCPALPNHLLLQFTRNNGVGDVSAFSASIPRGGDGRVRIIPILRRGYSLFSPAPINELTIAAFNRIRAEENAASADWQTTGLCYAALAGVHRQSGPEDVSEGTRFFALPPDLQLIPLDGGAFLSFTDAGALPRPMRWTMTFDGNGKLIKATHSVAPGSKEKAAQRAANFGGQPVQRSDAETKAARAKTAQSEVKPIQRTPVDVQGKIIPSPVDVQGKPIAQ